MLTALITLNRLEYLSRTLESLKNSGFFEQCPMDSFVIFDAGSDNNILEYLQTWQNIYKFKIETTNERITYFHQFSRIRDYALTQGHDSFLFIESDTLVATNFYQVADKLNSSRTMPWQVINLYATDNKNYATTIPDTNLIVKGVTTYYGTCLVIYKCEAIQPIVDHVLETHKPFDIATSAIFGPKNLLLMMRPSLAQHIGEHSVIGASFHCASDFVGQQFDANTLRLI